MKKSKVILALALAVVLMITCMNVPTFSWFTRPKEAKGDSIALNSKNDYTAYNGYKVEFSTMTSSDGGVTYDTAVTNYNGTSINPRTRKYFCTTITNPTGSEQNVSLYASKLSIPTTSTNGTLALGVNGPTRSYRNYTELSKPNLTTTKDDMRVYFRNNHDFDGWKNVSDNIYICWNDDPDTGSPSLDSTGSNGYYYLMTKIKYENGYSVYYADIPKTATHAFFAVQDWGTNNNGSENWGQRTQTLYNLAADRLSQTQSVVFVLEKSNGYNDSGNPQVKGYTMNGACINSYHSTITVAKGSTFNAQLKSGEAIGDIRYYSGNKAVFTVDEISGDITPVAEGEAILYTKSTGPSYGDTVQVETVVKVTAQHDYEFYDVPIVRNIKIPAAPAADSNDPDVNKVKVYWYVINNSDTKALSYKIDSLYLGL